MLTHVIQDIIEKYKNAFLLGTEISILQTSRHIYINPYPANVENMVSS